MVKLLLRDLRFSYPGRDVLDEVNFGVASGEMTGLIGPNGSGKSTLLKCIDTILKPRGTVLLDGCNVLKMDRMERARNIGMVAQHGQSALGATVFETVLMGRRPHSAWAIRDRDVAITAQILARLRIDDLANRDFASLSDGQKQMVFLARALCQEPQVLLLDEPTSALDIRFQLEVLEIIRQYVAERSVAAIVALHDLNLGARYTDAMIVLRRGRIHAAGQPIDLYTPELIRDVYGVQAMVIDVLGRPHVVPIGSVASEGKQPVTDSRRLSMAV